NLGLTETKELAKNALNKDIGGAVLKPVYFHGAHTNTGAVNVHTRSDGNNIGDSLTYLGYNHGTPSKPSFSHYLRGQGTTYIDTLNGCNIHEELRVGKRVVPADYGNFDGRYIQLNTNTKTTGYILSKAANLLDDPNSRHLGRSGFLRPNEGLNGLGALAIHVAHPSVEGSQYARGISFDYGYKNQSFNIATYAFDEDGNFKGSKKILTEDDLASTRNTAQKGPNGWWKCNDTGIIYQWGVVQGLNDNDIKAYSFTTHFPNQCIHLSAMGHLDKASWGGQMLGVHGWIIDKTQFKLASDVPENDDAFQYRSIFHWFAIGY
ncbi:gp53-like domain-containing protein, partial [Xenorhabdus stockiae]|uniref:gp53-like domain-containing protein n=1 Tax=Xenorhabdus stockiae TaxID=351614 RepID=UPI003BB4A7DC